MLRSPVLLVVVLLSLLLAGCGEERFTKSAAEDGQSGIGSVQIYGKVVAKSITSEEDVDQVSYKAIDSQGVVFYVDSKRPIAEGSSYVFTLSESICSENRPCELIEYRLVSQNYWPFLLMIPMLYLSTGAWLFYSYRRSKQQQNFKYWLNKLYPWISIVPDTRTTSVWCDRAPAGSAFVIVERVKVRKSGEAHHWDIVPNNVQVRPDPTLRSRNNGKLVIFKNGDMKVEGTISSYDRDSEGLVITWVQNDYMCEDLVAVPEWFGKNNVIQWWFDPENDKRVFVRGGKFLTGQPDLGSDSESKWFIGDGNGWSFIPQTWTRIRENQYIVISRNRDFVDTFTGFDCNKGTVGLKKQDVPDEVWERMVKDDGFIRMKFTCG